MAPAASAAEIDVNTVADQFNSDPAHCSLREAIQAANNNSAAQSPGCTAGDAGTDTITLHDGNHRITIAGTDDNNTAGDFDIASGGPLSIVAAQGAEAVVSGNGADRVLHVLGGATATFEGFEVTGGDAAFGGGIGNFGTLTLAGMTFTANHSVAFGGALFDGGSGLTVTDSLFKNNNSDAFGGGVFLNSTVIPTMTRSTVRNNYSNSFGGGIAANGSSQLDRVAVVNNVAAGQGGGIFLNTASTTSIVNSTIDGNSAAGKGGAISSNGGGQTVSLTNATLTRNLSGVAGGGGPTGGGIFQTDPSTVQLRDTILALNTDRSTTPAPDCNGTITSQGFNLLSSTQNCNFAAGTGDLISTDPRLAPLADNGGPTKTVAPLAGSPAIDAGASALSVDQRGEPRPQDRFDVPNAANGADIGAVELAATAAPPPKCQGRSATIVGTAKSDKLKGTKKADVIAAGAGNDTISALKGNDLVCSGAGKDTANGGAGKDVLLGEAGNDKLRGGTGNDKLKGGKGNDKLVGGPGLDKLNGGPGKDHAVQ